MAQVAVRALTVPPVKATALQPAIAEPSAVNATVPVGAVPFTVAVKVTLVPTIEGFAELASVVPLAAWLTTCDSVPLVEAVLPASPP